MTATPLPLNYLLEVSLSKLMRLIYRITLSNGEQSKMLIYSKVKMDDLKELLLSNLQLNQNYSLLSLKETIPILREGMYKLREPPAKRIKPQEEHLNHRDK
jgi:hypothetical protein